MGEIFFLIKFVIENLLKDNLWFWNIVYFRVLVIREIKFYKVVFVLFRFF